MKFQLIFALLLVLCIVPSYVQSWFGGISRTCKCSAVSDTVGFKFKGWDLSNCKFCGCTNAAMANCKQACIDTVSNYAKMGCGKLVGGSYVVPKHDAGSCSKGIHETKFKCAS